MAPRECNSFERKRTHLQRVFIGSGVAESDVNVPSQLTYDDQWRCPLAMLFFGPAENSEGL